MRHDRIDDPQSKDSKHSGGVSALADWAKEEWTTVAGAAHGLASVPGVVSKAWQEAAKTNSGLAETIRSTVDHWETETASARQTAIDALEKAAAPVSKTASVAAHDLGQANRLPLAVEKTIDTAVRGLPADAQHAVRGIARTATSAVNKLPVAVEAQARDAAKALDAAAAAQTAKASTTVGSVSKSLGALIGDVLGPRVAKGEETSILDKVPLLRDTPVGGALLTGFAIHSDVMGGKSVADATVANVGATLVGTAAGAAVTAGLSSAIESAAIADGMAVALGAAAAAGPVGWAVAGGVIAGAAAGYGVYKLVESKAGQDVIDGFTQLDKNKVGQGFGEGRSAVANAGRETIQWLSNVTKPVHQ